MLCSFEFGRSLLCVRLKRRREGRQLVSMEEKQSEGS